MTGPRICFRVDFAAWCSVGIGKIELLEAIQRSGSLSQAARDLSMSYRRAWLLVDHLNSEFRTPLVNASTGGVGGGGAVLTPFGRQLVKAYRALEVKLATLTQRQMGPIARHVARRDQRTEKCGISFRQSMAKALSPPTSA